MGVRCDYASSNLNGESLMLIILEGPDCTGKSTLATFIRTALEEFIPHQQIEMLHAGPPTRHPLDEYELPLFAYQPGTRSVVVDRWHWGERVYPAVLRRSSRMNDAVWLHLELFMQSRGALVMHLTASTTELRLRIRLRGDELITPDMMHAIRAGFMDCETRAINRFMRTSIMRPEFNNNPGRMLQKARSIIRTAQALEVDCRALSNFVTYVGPPTPDVLLLGDVRGAPVPARLIDGPAFMPYSASSLYLMQALVQVRRKTTRTFGIANACDVDDPHELRHALMQPRIVALGENASRKFPKAPKVRHPQYWNRFHHSAMDAYVNALLAAIEGNA